MWSKPLGNLLLLIIAQVSRGQSQVPALSTIDAATPGDIQPPIGANILPPYEPTQIRDALPKRASPGPAGIASIFPRRNDGLIEQNSPVVAEQVKAQEDPLNGIRENPLLGLAAITEKIANPFRRLTGTSSTVDINPFSFLKHFENYQKIIDSLTNEESCSSILNSIDQSIYTTRQLFQCSQAIIQLRDSLISIPAGTLISCFSRVGLKENEDIS